MHGIRQMPQLETRLSIPGRACILLYPLSMHQMKIFELVDASTLYTW
ncbi:hypothetical protein PoMZ_02814 [Pyricularia oryzae]|uniref:Uncharacterized protein n=1 Tax=Pyricularia oryzae TaxID=318829 RepID=A0A4P7N5P0_PYROR|nr:hypothetical protein PoMZ_02814 [Pyricularia oryzae]